MLFLFSSNIRPLYEQDILDVLAAPTGSTHRFRYVNYLLNTSAESQWEKLDKNTEVLIYFSLQQRAKYHDPVFIPVRSGRIRRCWKDANLRFIEFWIGDYVSLPNPRDKANVVEVAAAIEKEEHEVKDADVLSYFVKKHAKELEDLSIDRPYSKSASLHPEFKLTDSSHLSEGGGSTEHFEWVSKYLSRTDSFRLSCFLRCLEFRIQGASKPVQPTEDGRFELRAGKTYELSILQSQPREITSIERYSVSSDDQLVRVIGRSGFDIASPYDVVVLPLQIQHPGSVGTLSTVLVVEPEEGVRGPVLRIPVSVRPPKGIKIVAAASSLLLVAMGLPAIFPNLAFGVKILFLLVGAVGANVLWVFAPSGRTPLTPRT